MQTRRRSSITPAEDGYSASEPGPRPNVTATYNIQQRSHNDEIERSSMARTSPPGPIAPQSQFSNLTLSTPSYEGFQLQYKGLPSDNFHNFVLFCRSRPSIVNEADKNDLLARAAKAYFSGEARVARALVQQSVLFYYLQSCSGPSETSRLLDEMDENSRSLMKRFYVDCDRVWKVVTTPTTAPYHFPSDELDHVSQSMPQQAYSTGGQFQENVDIAQQHLSSHPISSTSSSFITTPGISAYPSRLQSKDYEGAAQQHFGYPIPLPLSGTMTAWVTSGQAAIGIANQPQIKGTADRWPHAVRGSDLTRTSGLSELTTGYSISSQPPEENAHLKREKVLSGVRPGHRQQNEGSIPSNMSMNSDMTTGSQLIGTLDPRYTIKDASFYTEGRVFALLFTENAPQGQILPRQGGIFDGPRGQALYSSVRRMVVVRKRVGYCICVSINTYGGRGLQKFERRPEDADAHAIIHMAQSEPELLPHERHVKKKPIAVTMFKNQKLDRASRIDFGKPFTIEYNCRTMQVGEVTRECLSLLDKYFEQEIGRRTHD